jgi:hypothetical protein
MKATIDKKIERLVEEIIELKLTSPYNRLIRTKNQELDRLIEEKRNI